MENEQQELAARKAEVTLEYEHATKERTEADTRIDAESKVATALEKEVRYICSVRGAVCA
jgi:hypothetical protein